MDQPMTTDAHLGFSSTVPASHRVECRMRGGTRKLLTTAATVSLIITAVGGVAMVVSTPERSVVESAYSAQLTSIPEAQPMKQQRPPSPFASAVGYERACGSVFIVDKLTQDALTARAAAQLGSRRKPVDGHALNGYADALGLIDRESIPPTMSAAVTAHSYALTNLATMIKHHAAEADINSTTAVVRSTSAVLQQFCRQ
ncbi:hypothetical protein A5751_24110 [Mycolicibacterium fortuitum]|nr:hypothetical protein A5751_24110 [Mycolicibacterium fortuitum]